FQGRTYPGSSSAPRRIWDSLSVGSPIAVRFVPAAPEINHPSEWPGSVKPAWVPGVAAGTLAGSGMLLIFLLRRETKLLSEGRPAPARVTGQTRVKGGRLVKYEFPLPGGGVGKGRGGKSRTPPPVGAIITILYHPDNPRRN